MLHKVDLDHRSDQHHIIEAAADNNISDVRAIFDSLDWTEENYRMFERIGQSAEQVHVCSSPTDEVSIATVYHSYLCIYVYCILRLGISTN